jgi:1,4-dihydroxy-2-naphthoate polyprenyltransferase
MKAIIQHLRFPFSLLLLPVFLFALVVQPYLVHEPKTWLLFFILHILVYPSSNAFNSLQDDDEGSIGMIEKPMPVPDSLRWITLVMDGIAVLLSLTISSKVAILLTAYIIASRLYSWRSVRLKAYPIIGFITVFIFQGAVIYFMINLINDSKYGIDYFFANYIVDAIACSCLIGSGYPLSQIYQHAQDKKDGVTTISMLFGYKGTFIFSGILFSICGAIFFLHFFGTWLEMIIFISASAIVGVYFTYWFLKVSKTTIHVNYVNAMRMNLLSCIAFNFCFLIILIYRIYTWPT